MNTNNTSDLPPLEVSLKATQKKLAEAISQRDGAIRLLRRQTLANAQLHRQIMTFWPLKIAMLLWRPYRNLDRRLRRAAPKPLKQFIKRHFLGIRS